MKFIYVDTSVFGGVFDTEFEYWSRLFFEQILKSKTQILISNVASDELIDSPLKVRDFVKNLPKSHVQKVNLTKEAIELANNYLVEGVVGKSSLADCYHIAIATILKADLLVSWNFKHIVNIHRIHGYNAINLLNGYQNIEIRSPREVLDYENKD
jgi:predicted nucleic acid-binding protein